MAHDGSTEHSHDDCEASGKYTEYISSHIEQLKEKCVSFVACIQELLKDESPLLVLKGEDISLNKTCGLVYNDGRNDYYTLSGKCTLQARNDIRSDIEHHLKDAVSDMRQWNRVKRCLSNKYGDKERTTYVEDICKLASKEKELCRNYNIHKKVESFFNEQIQHLKCTCDSLHKDDHEHGVPMAAIAGAAVGGLLFIILLAVIAFWCHRRHKSKKKKKSPNVIYLPAPNTDHPVYQEVFDDRPYQAHGFNMSPSSNPPTLPMRYTSHPKKGSQPEEPAYLEPVEVGSGGSYRPKLPRPRGQPTSNPNYDAPPEYSERDTKEEPDEPRYFQPLPTPPASPPPRREGEPGYDKLKDSLRNKEPRVPPEGYETVEEARSSVPLEEAPTPVIPDDEETREDTPLGPTPAARTKKPDRQTESHYYLLEEGSQKRHSEV